MLRIVALFLMLMPALSTAGVFKCVVDGKTTYSQRPCEEGAHRALVSHYFGASQGDGVLSRQPRR